MAEFESIGTDETKFWEKYCKKDGQRMCYQQILNVLKEQWCIANESSFGPDAAAAQAFFGGDLNHTDANNVFCYKKSGKWRTYSKDKTVAACWRRLLEENEGVWERHESQTRAE